MFATANDETRRVGRHDECRQPFLAELWVCDRKDDGEACALAVTDELLRAVQHPGAVDERRPSLQVVRLRTRLWFGQAEAPDEAALRHVGQIAALLLRRPEFEDGSAADRAVNADECGGRGTTDGDLLDRERVGRIVRVGAAPFLGHHHAEQTELAQLGHGGVGNPSGLVPFRGKRSECAAREIARGIANQTLLVGVKVGRHA